MRLCVFSASLLLVTLAARRPATADDLFPDKNLEAVVRTQVFEKRNKPDPLVEADVVNISGIKYEKSLKLAGKITNLAGLEKCKSLASIELPHQEIVDLAPLKDLKQLQSVILNDNKIQSVAPLAELTGIQLLWIQDNQISDVSPLAKIAAMGS
ncbi:MAG TPA: leucine-rich repeat domain-containing protein, partial [Pirellulaceae bacterium]|nr:leucine-rich repeat domain-containing protein [Pirellulaceae bacterium]